MTRLHFAGASISLAVAASLGACNPATPAKPAVDTSAIADAVKADVAQSFVDFNGHDAAKFASHSAADSVHIFHGMPNVSGAAGALASVKQTFASVPDIHVTLSDQSVDVPTSGDMAVFHSTYTTTLTDPKTKKPVVDKGNYLVGYKKQADGSWKQEWDVVSDFGPPPAAAPAAKS